MKIFTIGHSTHSQEKFVHILKTYEIKTLVDVRSYPGSRYIPHFNKERIHNWLEENGIKYIHLPGLGGRRKHIENIDYSLVEGWTHSAFRNYAAYTLTEDFEKSLSELINIAKDSTTCIMCAESLPWQCHRLIISNNLIFKNVKIFHIINEKTIPHELNRYGAYTTFSNSKVIYPKNK